jgi:hypothetical protein
MPVKVFGIEEYNAAVKKIIQVYPEQAAKFLNEQATKLVKKVRDRTPVGETKRLRRSWRKTKPKIKGGGMQIEVKSSAPHAHLIEYGHAIKRKKNGPVLGFVPGRHMLEISFNEYNKEMPFEVERWYNELVKELEV